MDSDKGRNDDEVEERTGSGSDRSEYSASEKEDSQATRTPDGNFALRKTEASTIQEAIKSYSETCIEKEQQCRDMNMRIYSVEGSVKAAKLEYVNVMSECRESASSVRLAALEAAKQHGEVAKLYKQGLFAATNAQDAFQTAITGLQTSSELMGAVH